MTGPRWTPEEDAVIAEVYPDFGARGCSERLDRTEASCASRAKYLGIRRSVSRGRSRSWDERDERIVAALLYEACRKTKRTPMAVIRHAEWLLRKAKEKARREGEEAKE